eukprot:UN23191
MIPLFLKKNESVFSQYSCYKRKNDEADELRTTKGIILRDTFEDQIIHNLILEYSDPEIEEIVYLFPIWKNNSFISISMNPNKKDRCGVGWNIKTIFFTSCARIKM